MLNRRQCRESVRTPQLAILTSAFALLFGSALACTAATVEQGPDDQSDANTAVPDAAAQRSAPPDAGGPNPRPQPPPSVDAGVIRGDASAGHPAPSGCINDVSSGHHVYNCQGMNIDVEIPAQCTTGGACGLIVDAHGLTMSAAMEDANTKMRALGTQHGYIIVQPNAAPPLMQWDGPTDDPILHSFLVTAIDALAVNPKRVHFSGFSDGGDTTFRFLCSHADMFVSMAAVAAVGCTFKGTDVPTREVHFLYMHGTKDALMDFQTYAVPIRDGLVATWQMGAPEALAQGQGFTRTRWTNAKGTVFEMIQHEYQASFPVLGGHCFPGSTDPGNAPGQFFSLACVPPTGFNWGEEEMRFFMAHESTP